MKNGGVKWIKKALRSRVSQIALKARMNGTFAGGNLTI